MGSMNQFLEITDQYRSSSPGIHNLGVLGLPEDAQRLRILWMYPDILSLHGGRGDIMALLRFASMANLPVDIRRVEQLTDPVPLDQADMLYFCCGDLSCVPDIVKALEPRLEDLQAFAEAGKVIFANGSSGAILAKELQLLGGPTVPGLGLLSMRWTERNSVHGDDLWLNAIDDTEVIGNEIKLADVTLLPGQAPFATVRYGRGNCGDGTEGAVTGNVIYTTCLGPVLVRNPALAMVLLRRGAAAAGLETVPEQFIPDQEDITLELSGLVDARTFIEKKMQKK